MLMGNTKERRNKKDNDSIIFLMDMLMCSYVSYFMEHTHSFQICSVELVKQVSLYVSLKFM